MDDILGFYVKSNSWEHNKFINNLELSDCYMDPLKLTDAESMTFLETSFEITANNKIRHWL